jgi:epoxyqueuosine reductase
MNTTATHTRTIRRLAAELGFSYCGIARAQKLDDDARRLEQWLSKGMHGGMSYMERNFELRVDPTRLVPGARSVVTLLMNHFPSEGQPAGRPRVARYAYGKDYHEVIRPKLNSLLQGLTVSTGPLQARGFVDSAPVLERSWALRSGLGWIGRNGNLINRKGGSYFFIATIILDLDLEYDDPFPTDHCGTCTRCMDSCPTHAILPDKVVDGSRCISYFTIELKDMLIPAEMKGRFGDWAFGCDVCQEVCPWNRFATPSKEEAFQALAPVLQFNWSDWVGMTEAAFKEVFRDSPLKRAGFKGIQRNLRFIRNTGHGETTGR